MKIETFIFSSALFILAGCGAMCLTPPEKSQRIKLIDDFTRADGMSDLKTPWRNFTDRVMGGVSTSTVHREIVDGKKAMRLKGSVSLENNGGFIQTAVALAENGKYIDASSYKGIRLWVKGNGEKYYIHLRNGATRLPWQYYDAEFKANAKWTRVDIPFSVFKPESIHGEIDLKTLRSLGIVGAKKKFEADISVSYAAFYGE